MGSRFRGNDNNSFCYASAMASGPRALIVRHLSWRDALVVGLPLLAFVIVAFWVAAHFVKPAPPDRLVMATGPEGGTYQAYALRYRDFLARYGVTLELRPSSGSVENLAKLRAHAVDVAFVQGGIAAAEPVRSDADDDDDDEAPVQSLGALYPEPLWVFERSPRNAALDLASFAGRRIAIGPEGSGTRALALELLRMSGVDAHNATLSPLTGADAGRALAAGELDALFLIAGTGVPLVGALIDAPGVRLQGLLHADAFSRTLAYAMPMALPRGIVDIAHDRPHERTQTIAVTANLLVTGDLHPALMYLLLDAATGIHGGHTPLADAGTFPNGARQDVPLAAEAQRFYRQGKPFLKRYLPYWLANLIDRLLVFLIPLIAVMYPAAKLLPSLYTWRLKSAITRRYAELRQLEEEIGEAPAPQHVADFVARLDAIDRGVLALHLPSWFAREAYELRSAIDLVRERLGQPASKAVPALRAGAVQEGEG